MSLMTHHCSTANKPLRWLHLSDIHIGAKVKADWWDTIDEFKTEVNNILGRFGAPDVVFLTGDLAYSGKAEEYQTVAEFIDSLCKWFGGVELPIVCIPNNHDVGRPNMEDLTNLHYELFDKYTKSDEERGAKTQARYLETKKY